MKIIGAIIGIGLTAMFLFMIWRLIGTYLPPRRTKDHEDEKKADR
ncbi:MAG TPA: hypothetical protein VG737_15360 [Cyclobacteriaceae bacterium]|nr:hypothetical protein [Cyclobacteriaceae bacterium]